MVRDGVIGFLRDTLSNNSGNLNRGKNKPNGYEPLAQFANQISQNFSTAEEKTVSAAAATEEPTDQVGRVLKKTALLILGENGEIPNLTKEEAKIAEAFFKARMLIQETEKNACNLTQNLLGEEAPIGQIAAGRLRAISHKEQMSPPLPLLDPVTPEGVVQIGKDSLAEAIKANNDALVSLKLAVEPQEIPPILRALIDVISPENTRSTAKSSSLIGEVETETRLKIGEVIEREGGARFKDEILKNGRLTDIAPLVTAINFINSDSSSLWGVQEPDETPKDLNRYRELGDGNPDRGRRFALVTTAINKYLDFKQSNYTGRLTGEKQKINLARELISHTGSDPINSLTDSELKGLANSGGLARGGFIDWVLKVTLNAVNDNKSQANSIGLSSYDDLLRLFNNIQSLTVTPPRPE